MESINRELLFISEVARMHGLSADTVRKDIRRGLLKAILTANGTRLIRREDAERRAQERAAEREKAQR